MKKIFKPRSLSGSCFKREFIGVSVNSNGILKITNTHIISAAIGIVFGIYKDIGAHSSLKIHLSCRPAKWGRVYMADEAVSKLLKREFHQNNYRVKPDGLCTLNWPIFVTQKQKTYKQKSKSDRLNIAWMKIQIVCRPYAARSLSINTS